MKRIAIMVSLILFFKTLHAQRSPEIFKPVIQGRWAFTAYSANMIKVSFTPAKYKTNENITGAVAAKPMAAAIVKEVRNRTDKFSANVAGFKLQLTGNRISIEKGNFKTEAACIKNGFTFQLQDDEKIFGGGERALPLDRRNQYLKLYNNPWYGYSEGADNLNYSVPFITSSRMYALFFDNASEGFLDIGKQDKNTLVYGASSGEMNFYFITGKNYPDILQSYHKLTGTQALPPRWALGTFMSRFGYTSEKQVKEIYERMKSAKIPFDAVIFDLFWFGDSIKRTLGNLDWVNKKKWPDPKKMIADFAKDNVKTILVTEPFILEGTNSYNDLKPFLATDSTGKLYTLTDFYFGMGGLIDIFRNDAKNQFWTYYKKQMDNGVEGWWGDLGEPEKHPADLYHNLKDFGYKRLFASTEVHNVYGHNWTKMLYDKFSKEYPDKRLFSLNRSGFAGTQRFCIFPWSGDVSRSWSGLRAQLPIMLGMSMSGVPYIHADAGGFAGGEGDLELYVRWLQFAQFTPVFRPHGTALYEVDPQAFSFPSEIAMVQDPYKTMAKQIATQRYNMMPYNYTLSYLQATKAEPLVSPLYYYFNNDTTTYNAADEFMWGKNILVAPILTKAESVRNIYLPQGSWYAWNSNNKISGQKTVTEKTSMEKIPVYVKAGSLIPLLPQDMFIPNSSAYTTKEIVWHYYADTDSSENILFDDNGSSKNSLQQKKCEVITAKAKAGNQQYQFEFSSNNGNFTGKPAERKFTLVLHGVNKNAQANTTGATLQQEINANGEAVISFVFTGKKVVITVSE